MADWTDMSLTLKINGENRSCQALCVSDLLKELELLPTQVAIEHNGQVLFRHEFTDTHLKSGDQIEIIRVVAGG